LNRRKTLIQKLKSEIRKLRKITKLCNPDYVKQLESKYDKLTDINLRMEEEVLKLRKQLIPKPKEKFFRRIWNAIRGE